MKVCTDSCLFGAWVASKIEKQIINPETILDIGCGTGLLSLMLAQKTNALTDAVEIEKNSFEQAAENINASSWNNQIKIFHDDIKNWDESLKYELVISNPPFYENDLLSEKEEKNLSKHSAGLSLEELISVAKDLLSEDGTFAVLLPWQRAKLFETTALQHFLFVKEKAEVRQTPLHKYFRTMLILQKQGTATVKNELTIKTNKNEYSGEFKELLKDYYLYL